MPPDPREDESDRKNGSGSQKRNKEDVAGRISDVTRLLEEMRRLGLEPAGLEKLIVSLHKLAVASGVSPASLASTIKEVSRLCEGREISLSEARKYIEQLSEQKKMLQRVVDDLERKKQSLEVELSLKELDYSATKQSLSEFVRIRQQLEQHSLSFADISKLVALIESAGLIGFSSSAIVDALGNLKSKESRRDELEVEIESLLASKRTLQERLLALDKEVSDRQQVLKSAEELQKLGFDFKELERLHAAMRMVAQTRNIDVSAAKAQFLSDLEGYYANDHELKKKVRIMESLLEEKEEKFKMLEADYQNEKAILEGARQLISSGLQEQWLQKLKTIIDAYGVDLELLAEELGTRQTLKASIHDLHQTKKALEEEERLLRQKVVAAEDQRLRTLSLINDFIVKSPQSLRAQQTVMTAPAQHAKDLAIGELSGLVRAANGESVSLEELKRSGQKAIETISSMLRKNSPARIVLEHARLALKYETEQDTKHSGA